MPFDLFIRKISDLVKDENGRRLAKRDHARSIRSLREKGMTAAEILDVAEAALSGSNP